MISNDACTGWKLQGATVDNIYAIEWFPACKNWVYVILSRVKKRTGLYLRRPISKNISDYRLNRKLVTMMGIMDKVTCKPINEDEFLNETSFKNTTKKTTKDSVNGETMSYQQTDERHYKDDESISSSLSTTSSLSSIDICRNAFFK